MLQLRCKHSLDRAKTIQAFKTYDVSRQGNPISHSPRRLPLKIEEQDDVRQKYKYITLPEAE